MWESITYFFWALMITVVLLATVICVFVFGLIYLFEKREKAYVSKKEWVYLLLKVPRVNEKSTKAVEQIFSQLHILAKSSNWIDKGLFGKFPEVISFEMVSLGGKTSFIVKLPKSARELIETAIYAQYPDSSISIVDDYLKLFSENDMGTKWRMWGSEVALAKTWALPIRTYSEFEHNLSEEKIIDPLKPLFEVLYSLQSYEVYAVQMLVTPILDKEWKGEGEKFASSLINDTTSAPTGQKSFSNLSDVEKARVNSVLTKTTKPGFLVKIRHLYIAPNEKYDASREGLALSAYKILGGPYINQFVFLGQPPHAFLTYKPFKYFAWLTTPWNQKQFWRNFVNRNFGGTKSQTILNSEELATLYHLPLVASDTAKSSSLEGVDRKSVQPPANLPIGELEI